MLLCPFNFKLFIYEKPFNRLNFKILYNMEGGKTAKIRNQYNQEPHLTQDTILKSVKITIRYRERSDSEVECSTQDPGAAGSSLTGVTALWSLSKTHFS